MNLKQLPRDIKKNFDLWTTISADKFINEKKKVIADVLYMYAVYTNPAQTHVKEYNLRLLNI